ncbi:glycosyltransferase [Massilia sp. R2A-15]|uniref:glycosyltransferase n=1 Tax=Massilia sp. R2A-15 TaxID=3064278 RepID=UPI0027341A27|nr:glycosyltransferase [Massilia sp. R2A-15]WLI91299.1 glycosyltransferase [Massilia sp. R2A-15]
MRVGILSYPMLFQRDGRLQAQVRATIQALNRIALMPGRGPVEAELVDPLRSRLDDYDLVHVFAAINGNHRIVEAAVELDVPVVLSALIAPGWNRADGRRARIADRLLGNLIGWGVQSSYAQTRDALQLASLVLAQGPAEKQAMRNAFLVDPDKVRVMPNGIGPHFFAADAQLFRARTGLQGEFALMAGPVSPYRNQIEMAQALHEIALPLVVMGEARERDAGYLRQLRAAPGVICMGTPRHAERMMASACAAASVFVLPGRGDDLAPAALEALAAGTPVLAGAECALELPNSEFALKKARWDDVRAQKRALLAILEAAPAPERVRALVRQFSWDSVALQLNDCYLDVAESFRRRLPQAPWLGQGPCPSSESYTAR